MAILTRLSNLYLGIVQASIDGSRRFVCDHIMLHTVPLRSIGALDPDITVFWTHLKTRLYRVRLRPGCVLHTLEDAIKLQNT
jgi:hypothetical protein